MNNYSLNGSIQDRFRQLDVERTSKLDRAREASALTIPSVLPPENWSEKDPLIQPSSSIPARGVTNLASRMLSALIPLNDLPFFDFKVKTGEQIPMELESFLNTLSHQVYTKIIGGNFREITFAALQQLIVTGDVILVMEDDFNFRLIRQDHYVLRRDIVGNPVEIIHLEYVPDMDSKKDVMDYYDPSTAYGKKGYETIFVRIVLNEDDDKWHVSRENEKGETIDSGVYTVLPYSCLRWTGIAGENYGRSHCEEIMGDIQSLEAFTEAQLEGMAAASAFWIGVNPAGVTNIEDIAGRENGSYISARREDVFTISPSDTLTPQIQSISAAVETMRREVSTAFLMSAGAIPSGDRVTATAVRMIGSELETILGGAFSAIAREMMEPIVRRAVFMMIENEDIDPRLASGFASNGVLDIEILTGLQALSRDSELTKLIQMGEMVRNLPPESLATFRWDAYTTALITALGFDPTNWVKSEEDVQTEQNAQMDRQLAMQQKAQMAQMGMEAASGIAQQAIGQQLQSPGNV